MSQSTKGKLNFRCPSCFMRDIDIDMFFEEEKKEYYKWIKQNTLTKKALK